MSLMKKLPNWCLTNPSPAFYETESGTVIEQTAKVYGAMNELIDSTNKFADSTTEHIKEQDKDIKNQKDVVIPKKITDEVQEQIDNGTFDRQINSYIGNLEERVNTLLSKIPEGGTTSDAELIDIRTDEEGVTHINAGESVRYQFNKAWNETVKHNTILKRNFTNIGEGVPFTLVENKIVNNGVIMDYNTLTGFSITEPIPVNPDESYYVRTFIRYGNDIVTFYDVNENHIVSIPSTFGGDGGVFEDVIIVPKGASTMIVSTSENHLLIEKCDVKLRAEEIGDNTVKYSSLTKSLSHLFVPANMTPIEITYGEYTSHLLGDNGNMIEYNQYDCRVSDLIPVRAGDEVCFNGNSWLSGQAFAFYNYNEDFICSYPALNDEPYKKYENLVVKIPEDAKYMRVSYIHGMNVDAVETSLALINSYELKRHDEWSHLKWCCVGDSLTEHNSRTTKNYDGYIAERTGIEVVNMGRSGTGYARTQDEGFAFYQRVSDVPADCDVVTIFGSFNDLGSGLPLGDITDGYDDTICGCINKTIDNLYEILPTVQLGIVSPTPWINTNPYSGTSADGNNYVEALKNICERRGIPFLDLYHCSNLRPWDERFRTLAYSKDDGNGVHPNEAGHKILSSHFYGFLQSLIGTY